MIRNRVKVTIYNAPPAAILCDTEIMRKAPMRKLGMPMKPEDIGISRQEAENAFLGSREVRARYMTSCLLWDLGLLYRTELPE